MNDSTMTCSMCGYAFDPSLHASCNGCPIQKGCQLVCCPQCGFEMVNPDRSKLARWAKQVMLKLDRGTFSGQDSG